MPSRLLRGAFAAAVLLCGAAPAVAANTIFDPLFMVTKVVGEVRIEKPNGTTDVIRKDHAYPFGSRILVPTQITEAEAKAYAAEGAEPEEPQVFVRLARDFSFRIGPGSDVRVVDQSTGEGDDMQELKVFDLAEGVIDTRISAAVKKNGGKLDERAEKNLSAVIVRTPCADSTRLAERNRIQVQKDPDTPGYFNCYFESSAGYMEIHGPQFDLDRLRAATRIRIDGNRDFTAITPDTGEFTGTFEKGADNNEKIFFRTRTVAKLWRRHAEVGGRLVVAVMVSYPDGQRRTYQYLEGQTGVDAEGGPTTKIDGGEEGEEGESGDDWGGDGDSSGDDWGGDGDDSSGGDDFGGDDDFGDWSF